MNGIECVSGDKVYLHTSMTPRPVYRKSCMKQAPSQYRISSIKLLFFFEAQLIKLECCPEYSACGKLGLVERGKDVNQTDEETMGVHFCVLHIDNSQSMC